MSSGGNDGAWLILGFTVDDVVGAGQDWRFAWECVRAWRRAGCPADFRVLQAGGEGRFMVYWFVNAAAATVLDAQKVDWRERVVGSQATPPANARDALNPGA